MYVKHIFAILLLLSFAEANPINMEATLKLMRRSDTNFMSCVTNNADSISIPAGAIYSLSCKLKEAPAGDVLTFVSGDVYKFDTTGFTFTPTNWNIAQAVNILANSCNDASQSNSPPIVFSAYAEKESYHLKQDSISVVRDCGAYGVCKSVKEKGLSRFNLNGETDFGESGTFNLVKSNAGLSVQGEYKCASGNRSPCVNTIAIQYGDSVLIYTASGSAYYGPGSSKKGISYTLNGGSLDVNIETGSNIKAALNGHTIDYTITLTKDHKTKTDGLCGYWEDGIKDSNTYYTGARDKSFNMSGYKSKAQKRDDWARSWKATTDTFNGQKYTFNAPFGFENYHVCSLKATAEDMKATKKYKKLDEAQKEKAAADQAIIDNLKLTNEAAAAKAAAETSQAVLQAVITSNDSSTSTTSTTKDGDQSSTSSTGEASQNNATTESASSSCPTEFKTDVTSVCMKAIIEVTGCSAVTPFTRTDSIAACVKDALKNCNHDKTSAYHTQYVSICKTKMDGIYSTGLLTSAPQTCPDNCTNANQGKCTSTGCVCASGYSGTNCAIKIVTLPTLKSVSNTNPVFSTGMIKSNIESSTITDSKTVDETAAASKNLSFASFYTFIAVAIAFL